MNANFRIGPVRTHLYNYIYAGNEKLKNKNSKIYFRVDDSNKEKGNREMALQLFSFFSDSLGMRFDISESSDTQIIFQSERAELYNEYLTKLFDLGVVFIDKESGLTLFDIEKYIENNGETVKFEDVVRGEIIFELKKLLERQKYFPVVRSDGSVLYHLASVADDHSLGITHIVRGIDKLSVAQYQEMIRVVLGLEPKVFMHTPLVLNTDGGLLKGDVLYDSFIKKGILPQSLMSYMVSSGYGDPDAIYGSIDEIIEKFDYKKIRQNNGKFDLKKLLNINKKIFSGINNEDYEISVRLFLSKVNREDIQKTIDEVPELLALLVKLRVPFEKMEEFYKTLSFPDYSDLKTLEFSTLVELKKIVEKNKDNLQKDSDIFALANKDSLKALRFFLIGKFEINGGLLEILNYLHSQNKLEERVSTLNELLKTEVPKKS
ncbi:MAG: glutamate--tRNA ligase family protein [Candidatus Parcubacteria bacterium]|nr:glutamate--tRNA ligase family protein [Candidatus Parcubacteria bacterium]